MNQNQCVVPSWGVEDHVPPIPPVAVALAPPPPSRVITSRSHSNSLSAGPDISLLDYEVTELTWENGQLTMHGLGLPRVPSKPNLASGTLESVVNQATKNPPPPPGGGACINDDDLVPLLDGTRNSAPPSVSMSMDALVPTAANNNGACAVGCSTRVGSCSVAAARVPVGSDWSVSASEMSARRRGDTCQQMSGGVNGMTSTSFALSLDNTKMTGGDDHDSVCHSRPQRKRGGEEEEENEKKGTSKSSGSAKRSRAAAIHNQSERKRRDKINQRMKTLQKLVPNSNKTDKASMLDEVIDYLKQLQAQVQMISRMGMPSMMMTMPMAIQQQLQMSMMSQMGMGMGMGMMGMGMAGMGMAGIDHMNNINPAAAITRPTNVAGMSTAVVNPSALMPRVTWDGVSAAPNGGDRVLSHQPTMVPSDPLSAYLACPQSQPMTTDAYSRMVAMYQQLQQQQQQLGSISNS